MKSEHVERINPRRCVDATHRDSVKHSLRAAMPDGWENCLAKVKQPWLDARFVQRILHNLIHLDRHLLPR